MWTSWETRCGIAAYAAALARELERLGVAVDVVPVPYTDRDPGRRAAALARSNAAELVHVQHEYTFWGGVAPGASSLPAWYRGLRRPRVVTAHTVFTAAELLRLPQERRPRQRLAKRLLASLPAYRRSVERAPFAGAAAVIVHTEAARERMLQRGLPKERVFVLPAGIPRPYVGEDVPARAEALRERYGLRGTRVATIFGYVTPDKGYETALAALASLPPTVKLLIGGGTRVPHEAPYLRTLQERIRAAGLEPRVGITGYLEEPDVAAAMAVSDLVLVPHTAANGSYSVMIALAYGKPVLASDLACFRELWEQHRCLELFEAGNERQLAERMGFLLASAGTRARLSRAALEFARERGWDAVARRTLAIYEEALRRAGLRRMEPVGARG